MAVALPAASLPMEVTMMRHSTLCFDGRQARRILSLWLWVMAFGFGVWADDLAKAAALPAGLSESERKTLQKEAKPKDHFDACLKIGIARLATAAESIKRENFDVAAQALRVYAGVIDYAHGYTRQVAKQKARQQMLRKLETTLRQHLPLLEWMANGMPECHEGCVRQALSRAQVIRRESLNAFFGSEFLKAGAEATTE
ncbi:MAG: hypothetical protein CFK52_07850 [Chloracidobacterium sp. CP2_5A]|nr:MAG: hypothetical protein CFK52_07850 [Chloracidobacterium sp. CP2_5A]